MHNRYMYGGIGTHAIQQEKKTQGVTENCDPSVFSVVMFSTYYYGFDLIRIVLMCTFKTVRTV